MTLTNICCLPDKCDYKLKPNGYHFVGVKQKFEEPKKKKKDKFLIYFEPALKESEELVLEGEEKIKFINMRMCALYKADIQFNNLLDIIDFDCDFTDYIEQKIKQKNINFILRKQRFKEKANLHCWNYFVTQTYDSTKFNSEEEFKKAYKTCLSHLATDYGWRYMGVWEKGSVSGRLHFHGVFYIPKGSMKGFLKESKYFNPIRKRMEKSVINSFFTVRFGRNDFQLIENDITGITNYIIKYIGKTDEKIVYSRHIEDCIHITLDKEDISFGYKLSYCTKYIIFDTVLKNTILDPYKRRGESYAYLS